MGINDIKKTIYKEKPKAELLLIDKEGIHYECSLMSAGGEVIYFKVPFEDIGDAKFLYHMEASLMIRYLVVE